MKRFFIKIVLLQIDSTRNGVLTTSDKITIVSIIVTVITILLAINVKKIVQYVNRIRSNASMKFDKSHAHLIEKYVNDFLITRDGLGYCLTHKAAKDKNEKLEVKIKESLLKLRKQKVISEIQNDVYYFYLFSILKGTSSNVMAISVSSPYEWTETEDEKLFLKYNLEASIRKLCIERIFIIKEADTQKLLENKAILEQIIHSQTTQNFNTFYVYDKDVPQRLLREISKGFLLFENVAVAKDADPDADGKDIEGFLEMNFLERYKNIFNSLKKISYPLNQNFYKEKTGKDLHNR